MTRQLKDRTLTWRPGGYALPMRPKLMPHQQAGIAWMLNRSRCLHAGAPGVGKSAQIIGVVNTLPADARILVLCPSGLRSNWLAELAIWLTIPRRCQIAKRYIPDCQIVILQYDALAKFEVQLRAVKWDLIVMDEAHALKSSDSIKAQQILGSEWTERLIAPRIIIATATPILNRPAELWPLLSIIGLPISRIEFAERFCSRQNPSECTDLKGLRALLAPIMLRQTKDCLNLPPKTRRVVALEPSGELVAVMQAESLWCREIEKAGEFAGGVAMGKLTELRRKTALAKIALPAVRDRLYAAVAEDGKLVVMVHHQDALDAVAALFEPEEVVCLSGQSSPKQRQDAVRQFQRDPAVKVFIGAIGAAGVGITLTAARRMILLESGWTPALIEQAEDRIHRIGQMQPVLVEHFAIRGSVDARQFEIQAQKTATISAIMGNQAA